MRNVDRISWLEGFFARQCNGDWEHSFGIDIGTLDNPGWRIRIDIPPEQADEGKFPRVERNISDLDWFHCWVDAKALQFHGAGGARNLHDILDTFIRFASEW